jgi:hypothetical protein
MLPEWLWNLDLILSVFGGYHDLVYDIMKYFLWRYRAKAKSSNDDPKTGPIDYEAW